MTNRQAFADHSRTMFQAAQSTYEFDKRRVSVAAIKQAFGRLMGEGLAALTKGVDHAG